MRSLSFGTMLIISAIFLAAITVRAATEETNYSGHYELADTKAKRDFTLDVKQTGSRAEIAFEAAMEDGSGAAPDATGKGRVEDGILAFKFKDSFNNEGTCTLQPGKGGFQLSITIVKAIDPRPFHFYGTVALKRTSDKPQGDFSDHPAPKTHAPQGSSSETLPQ